MPRYSEPAYLVNAISDPVIIKINGRANYLNCAPVKDFFERMIARKKTKFLLDLSNCTGLDSTFLGLIAGVAMDVSRLDPPGSLTLCRPKPRLLEVVRNLGLHRIIEVDSGDFPMNFDESSESLNELHQNKSENTQMILNAHEKLLEIEEGDNARFQDIVSFLKRRMD